jgi:hypothetical protein
MIDRTPNLSHSDIHQAAHKMDQIGGGFAMCIAQAYFRADPQNRERLLYAFGDLFERFHIINGGK